VDNSDVRVDATNVEYVAQTEHVNALKDGRVSIVLFQPALETALMLDFVEVEFAFVLLRDKVAIVQYWLVQMNVLLVELVVLEFVSVRLVGMEMIVVLEFAQMIALVMENAFMELFVNAMLVGQVLIALIPNVNTIVLLMESVLKEFVLVIRDILELIVRKEFVQMIVMEMECVETENAHVFQDGLVKIV